MTITTICEQGHSETVNIPDGEDPPLYCAECGEPLADWYRMEDEV